MADKLGLLVTKWRERAQELRGQAMSTGITALSASTFAGPLSAELGKLVQAEMSDGTLVRRFAEEMSTAEKSGVPIAECGAAAHGVLMLNFAKRVGPLLRSLTEEKMREQKFLEGTSRSLQDGADELAKCIEADAAPEPYADCDVQPPDRSDGKPPPDPVVPPADPHMG